MLGYEIHHGQTAQHPAMAAAGDLARVALTGPQAQPLGWQNAAGNVLGLYLHGLFEDPVLQALFGASRADARQCVRRPGRFRGAALRAGGAGGAGRCSR
jgi:cobyric acid synthase